MSKIKGIEQAVATARKIKSKIFIAGSIDDKKLFDQVIKNDRSGLVRYLGELGFQEKVKFFAKAKAFLYPLQWEEPFGLVMVEAMACGTPVIAFRRGAVPEVVKDKETGFVVNPLNKNGKVNIEGLIEAIKKIDQIDRSQCRRHVEENFSVKKMADGYEEVYCKIIENWKRDKYGE
ncbi:MAG: hypothetical protein DRM99_05600 [Thermoplasmata archaeon]|nr:MAG: hypothetical protein DRM99_05600 [Thermoplasmata archaeon]